MKQTETTHQHKRSSSTMPIGIIGLFFFAGCFPIILEIISLFAYELWPHLGLRYLLRFLYLPQVGMIALAIVSVVAFVIAIRNDSLRKSNTYIPLIMLIIYGLIVALASHLILDYSVRTKIDNVESRKWSDAMVGRALAAYPTGLSCRLSPQIVAMIREWSFVTPDGHMPAMIWSESSAPNSELIGSPMSCTQLQPNWYVCYLTKPYQLIIEDNVCG